jgi:8-oxo-dGTP pyrophosphatase MutT (NUDIX family)
MPLAEFVTLHEVSEAQSTRIAVPTFAVVIARGAGGAVLVFNRFRKVWELPGGLIDPGESLAYWRRGASLTPLGATDAALLDRFA